MAVLIRDQGVIRDFPWLQFTILKDYYTDHHFLYHLLLVPFVTFLDPLIGIKLATATFAAFLILTFYWFLEKFKIKSAFFYSLLILTLAPFIFRINLAKAGSLSIIILLIGLYFIFNKKYWQLFALSYIYVWTHGSWPLILILTSFYILGDLVIKVHSLFLNQKFKIQNSKLKILGLIKNLKLKIINLSKNGFIKENIKLFSSCFLGLITGIIINPYFPKNLIFYWHQIIKIAVINYQDKINVGAEWYPYSLGDLIANSSFIFILLTLVFTNFFIKFIKYFAGEKEKYKTNSKERIQILTLTLLSIFFLILTLRSRRNVEYFVPFALLFVAFYLNQPLSFFNTYWLTFKIWRQKRKILASSLCLFFMVMLPFTAGRNILSVKKLFDSGSSTHKYQGIAEWLKNNTPQGSIVFHNDWDDFPALFYYNTHNYYIAGLDPTFMYDYNKDLHKKWVDITTGKQDNISKIVNRDFSAEYVFVDKDHIALENNLKRDGYFKMVYKDGEGKIYQLTSNQ